MTIYQFLDEAHYHHGIAEMEALEAGWRHAYVAGAAACREMLARFVEAGGDAVTAASIRANWNPSWGPDPSRAEPPITPTP